MDATAHQGRTFALRWLARRPLTEAEIRRRLAGRGIAPAEVERTLGELIAAGLIDDEALAADYIVLRSRRLRLGKERLLRDLRRRGVDADVAQRAYRAAVDDGDVEPDALLREAVARRLARESRPTDAARRRVYNALLRAGFSAAELNAELGRQWPQDTAGHGYHDDEGA
jgi:regulatory protein